MKKKQYRFNQGRNPKQVETTYRVITFVFKLAIITAILALIFYSLI